MYEGEKADFKHWKSISHYTTEYLIPSVNYSDHRWTFHSERVQPTDFENSPLNPLTELQPVSPQQLIQPYRYSSESLPLHLDPPLGPLSVSPQVGLCLEMNALLFIFDSYVICTYHWYDQVWLYKCTYILYTYYVLNQNHNIPKQEKSP